MNIILFTSLYICGVKTIKKIQQFLPIPVPPVPVPTVAHSFQITANILLSAALPPLVFFCNILIQLNIFMRILLIWSNIPANLILEFLFQNLYTDTGRDMDQQLLTWGFADPDSSTPKKARLSQIIKKSPLSHNVLSLNTLPQIAFICIILMWSNLNANLIYGFLYQNPYTDTGVDADPQPFTWDFADPDPSFPKKLRPIHTFKKK